MKKFIIFSIILAFIFMIDFKLVNAGVCDGKELGLSGYCVTNNGTKYTKVNSKIDNADFMPIGFTAEDSSLNFSGNSGIGFCLDPSLKSPSTTNNLKRELDLSNTYDKWLYNMYLQFVNDMQYSDAEINLYRAVFEATSRILTIEAGNGYITKSSGNIVYKNDATQFYRCTKAFINVSSSFPNYSDDQLFVTKDDGAADSSGNLPLSVDEYKKNNLYCFGNNYDKIQKYYDYAKNGGKISWTNPFLKSGAIKSNIVKPTETDSHYYVNYTIKGLNSFFTNDTAVNSIGLKAASFNAFITVDGVNCNSSSCNVIDIYNDANITFPIKSSTNDTITITVKMTQEQFNNSKIVLNYEYNHPMNVENIFITRKAGSSGNSVEVDLSEQRMLTIYNYNNIGQLTVNGTKTENNSCNSQTLIDFVKAAKSKVEGTKNFIKECGCNSLSLIDFRNYDFNTYSSVCTGSSTGFLGKCTVDINDKPQNIENYELVYREEDKEINPYTTLICSEYIKLKDVPGTFGPIKAGMYFSLYSEPKLEATRACTLMFQYRLVDFGTTKKNGWVEDHHDKLNSLVKSYNAYVEELAKKDASSETAKNACTCTKIGIDGEIKNVSCDGTRYEWKWVPIKLSTNKDGVIDDSDIVLQYGELEERSKTCCDSDCDSGYNASKFNSSKNSLNSAIKTIAESFSYLREGNTYLESISLDEFYKFKEDFKFHYSQNIYNNENSTTEVLWNSDIDMELYDKTVTDDMDHTAPQSHTYTYIASPPTSSTSGKISSKEIKQKYLDWDWNDNKFSYQDMGRTVTYKGTYRTTKPKLTNSYFGNVSEYTGSSLGKNEMLLGPIYNVDAMAIKKDDNQTYFAFNTLGHDNQVYENFKANGTSNISTYSYPKALVRECSYKTTNDLVCIPNTGDPNCDTNADKVSSKILFKIVDSDNIDPNGRITDEVENNGFKNWENKITVVDAIQNEDTFNPSNLEYSFDLDSAAIKTIRNYNDTQTSYGDYENYTCDSNGNFCKSGFIDTLVTEGIGTIKTGRSEWMVYFPEGVNTSIIDENISADNIYKVNLEKNYKYTLID